MSFLSALKSKTVWAGIGTTALGVGQLAAQFAPTILSFIPPATPAAAAFIATTGLITIIGRVKARQPLGPVIGETIKQTIEAVHVIGTQSNLPNGARVTTVPAPLSDFAQQQQLAEVTALVKAPGVLPESKR